MTAPGFLIAFPLAIAMLLLVFRARALRNVLVIAAAVVIAAGSLSLVLPPPGFLTTAFSVPAEALDWTMLGLELAMAVFIFYLGVRHVRHFISLLALLQAGLAVTTEVLFRGRVEVLNLVAADKFSFIMAGIVGIVGSLIAVYSLGYMKAYHEHHREYRDRQPLFFFLQFVFLGAMFGVFFSNSLSLLLLFWEITTLCSFLLIGYNGTAESRGNAFLALTLNLLGGLAFAGAILFLASTAGTVELDRLISMEKGAAIIPAALLAFAGMTKSAQMPFSSWLLGAMVAPTPVSALLHSSTMVKAGVYLVLRLAPVLRGTIPGTIVALIGGITFLAASLIAISQSDAKRVLAWSTIANLGLIVLCGGIGTYEALWAGILLILFHAVTKALLFLCVGAFEQKTNTRDIESMSGLIVAMPKLSIMIQIGIAGMFLAPFGMLVSKWAVLRALVDSNPLLVVFVVFGSSATLFFWVKWMGKLLQVTNVGPADETGIAGRQWAAMGALSALSLGLVGFYPLISAALIEPYVRGIYGMVTTISQGNFVIMAIMLGMVALFPVTFFVYQRKVRVVDAYLGGGNVDSSVLFQGAGGRVKRMEMRNYYLARLFGERRLSLAGGIACAALIFVMFGAAL
ncbi:MAG: proton-conducting transporter membrane subunit [Spirochaetia bacterium]